MQYSDLYLSTLKQLENTASHLEVQLIMESAFNMTRAEFWIKKNAPVTDSSALRKFYRLRKRLLMHEPVAYILREKEFYSFPFYVKPGVLIPRPETELLVDRVKELATEQCAILDIGAGSGNISVTLARETPSIVTAAEIDPVAITVLRKNIRNGGVPDKVTILRTDLFPPKPESFDIIVSNPPYLTDAEWEDLPPHIKNYEPRNALTSGPTGLEILSRIIRTAPDFLKKDGYLLLEIGYNQCESVTGILRENGFSGIQVTSDLNNIPRVVQARC